MRIKQSFATLFLCGALGAPAAASSLGFMTSGGSFDVNRSRVWRTATLFDGSLLESRVTPLRIHLAGGAEIQLAPQSRARFYPGRAVIEKGAMRLEVAAGYRVEAGTFQLSANAAHTVAAVEVRGTGAVVASTGSGQMLAASRDGAPLANVSAGNAVSLTPEPGGGVPGGAKISGCLMSAKRAIVLVDQASNLTFMLHGSNLASEIGNRVEITGGAPRPAPDKSVAPQIIDVTQVSRLEAGVCVGVGPVRKGPLSRTGVRVALLAGVSVAGVMGGLERSGVFSSADTETQPDTSR